MKIPVYISHATPHTAQLMSFLEKMKRAAEDRGLECVMIKSCDIRTNDTISAIRKKLSGSYGLIAVAYERRRVISAVNKMNADLPNMNEGEITQKKETTPYIQIETAMALASDLPVVVFKENGLIEEGILEPYCAGITGPTFDVGDDSFFTSVGFDEAMDAFCAEVKEQYIKRHTFAC